MSDVDDTLDREDLHWPGRAELLEPLAETVLKAARLSRALWAWLTAAAKSPSEFSAKEGRDADALRELASEIADHASAADYLMRQPARDPERRSREDNTAE